MIVSAIQKGGMIYVYDENGHAITKNGYLVSFTGTTFSYVTSRISKIVLVYDDKGRFVRSFNAPVAPLAGK